MALHSSIYIFLISVVNIKMLSDNGSGMEFWLSLYDVNGKYIEYSK